jgi:hypothetical protein
MADERDLDTGRTPDKRIQHDELRRKEKEGIGRQGPSPYDIASEAMRDDRVIEKGEREKPGPTATELNRDDEEFAEEDGLLQSDEARSQTVAGMGGMSGSLEDAEMLEAYEDSGTLGGGAHHRRINNEQVREDMPDDEESA